MKFIFESESTINSYKPDYTIDYDRDIEDAEIDFEPKAVALDLLSAEEVEKLPESARRYQKVYWLRSPGNNKYLAATVNSRGVINHYGGLIEYNGCCVRPALTLSNLDSSNFKLYENYIIDDDKWIYIGENKFLYNDETIVRKFDDFSNTYESSYIKKFLNRWLRELQNKKVVIDESYSHNRMKIVAENWDDDMSWQENVPLYRENRYSNNYIELNDNNIFNRLDFNGAIKTSDDEAIFYEVYTDMVNAAAEKFERITGVPIYLLGRSGRHVCVELNKENAERFDELQDVQEKLEKEFIDEVQGFINNFELRKNRLN